MLDHFDLQAIATVHNSIPEAVNNIWGSVISRLELDNTRFTTDALLGLNEFSHVEVVFLLHSVAESEIEFGLRHPRGRQDLPEVGIFAQRGRARPNRIGVTVCQILSIGGLTVEVQGLDAIDGTPVLDLKPYMPEFAPRGAVREPPWAKVLMEKYWG